MPHGPAPPAGVYITQTQFGATARDVAAGQPLSVPRALGRTRSDGRPLAIEALRRRRTGPRRACATFPDLLSACLMPLASRINLAFANAADGGVLGRRPVDGEYWRPTMNCSTALVPAAALKSGRARGPADPVGSVGSPLMRSCRACPGLSLGRLLQDGSTNTVHEAPNRRAAGGPSGRRRDGVLSSEVSCSRGGPSRQGRPAVSGRQAG